MSDLNAIRADYDAKTTVVYGAYSPAIANPALAAQKFVSPYSFTRMTWLKPSFLWLMERSNWGRKSGQERTLAVRITRAGWDEALSMGVLTSYFPTVHPSPSAWQREFDAAQVHVQWDPERTLRGGDAGYNSIQVGISRHLIERYVAEWIVSITDLTPLVTKIVGLVGAGHADKARTLLPREKHYKVSAPVARRLLIKL